MMTLLFYQIYFVLHAATVSTLATFGMRKKEVGRPRGSETNALLFVDLVRS